MATIDEVISRPLAKNPKSDREELRELAYAAERFDIKSNADYAAKFLMLLGELHRTPGVTEQHLWARVANDRVKIGGSWEVEDEAVSEFVRKASDAIHSVLQRQTPDEKVIPSLAGWILPFLDLAQSLEDSGNVDGAIDIVNDSFDELLRRGSFPLCDAILTTTDPAKYSTDILLTVLTATAPARQRLRMRGKFFGAVTKVIKGRKQYERGLLDGLE